jgi:molybdenum cofactor cytidylyltransferase
VYAKVKELRAFRDPRYTHPMFPAIVLAAGRSSRFGGPKALASAGGTTFIAQILQVLRHAGVDQTLVVVRPGDEAILKEVQSAGLSARSVVNPDPDRGQLSSLLAGVNAVDAAGVDGVLVMLVDMPLVTSATIRRLIQVARSSPALILRAACGGRHGHPVVFKRGAFDSLRHADPSVGARSVVHALPTEDVEVDDRGVVEDVDTPADYQRLFERDGRP